MARPAAVDELVRAAQRPFEDAVAMPPGVYTSDQFLALELDTVFRREWTASDARAPCHAQATT